MTASVPLVAPALDAEGEIGMPLDALLSQTVAPDEILVVDSSSADATREIVASCAERDVSLEPIGLAGFNHGATRYRAFLRTRGDYTLSMNSHVFSLGRGGVDGCTNHHLSTESSGGNYPPSGIGPQGHL